jgi:cytochrome c
MMAMTISCSPSALDLPWQIKHVRARLGRPAKGRIASLQTVDFTLGQACMAETGQGFATCPIEAGLPQATAPKLPGRDEEHPMKKSILSALVIVTSLAAISSASAQDAAAGKSSFNKCLACHAIGEGAKNKVGPELNGIDGRKSGTAPDYSYSDANKNSGITWNEAQFKEYIKDPKAKIPGTKMAFAGIKNEKEINDLWAFISQYDKDGKTK